MTDGQKRLIYKAYDRYGDRIFNFLMRKLSNRHDAEDMIQDVFTVLIKNIHRFKQDNSNNMKTWLFTVANHKVIDFYRKGKNKQTSLVTETGENIDLLDTSRDTEKEFLSMAEKNCIENQIRQMNETDKELMTLRITENFSFREISKITGRSTVALKTAFHRGKTVLIQMIKGNCL